MWIPPGFLQVSRDTVDTGAISGTTTMPRAPPEPVVTVVVGTITATQVRTRAAFSMQLKVGGPATISSCWCRVGVRRRSYASSSAEPARWQRIRQNTRYILLLPCVPAMLLLPKRSTQVPHAHQRQGAKRQTWEMRP